MSDNARSVKLLYGGLFIIINNFIDLTLPVILLVGNNVSLVRGEPGNCFVMKCYAISYCVFWMFRLFSRMKNEWNHSLSVPTVSKVLPGCKT